MLDVKRLRILREVAQRGSFSAAADELYLSQSAVSQQIATLEREVGMKLLDRTREGPKLTDAGRVLVSHADAAIARLEEAERELASIAGLEGGELRLASFPVRERDPAHGGRLDLSRAPPEGPAEHRRRRARGVAAPPARRRAGSRPVVRLPLGPRVRGARPRADPGPDRVDAPGVAERAQAGRAPGRRTGRAVRRGVALRVGRELVRRGRHPGLSRCGLRAEGRILERRLRRDAGLHLRRPRLHPACPTSPCRRCATISSSARPTRPRPSGGSGP